MNMHRHAPGLATAGAVSILALFGCQPPAAVDLSGVEEKLAKIEKGQDKILSRIADVEKAAKAGGGGGRAPAPAAPARPDSDTVHKVDISAAQWKGSNEAKITIVEWSDFQ
jgi:hypothetical protein